MFVGSLGMGFLLAEASLSLGIAVQLALQTAGLLWLYLPVAGKKGSSSD